MRSEPLAVIQPLLVAGIDPGRVWVWLTTPAGLLGGAVPHEAARDPEELPIVQHAAAAPPTVCRVSDCGSPGPHHGGPSNSGGRR